MLRARIGVCHDPGSGLEPCHAVVEENRPDRDARVERAALSRTTGERVADRARVGTATVALELGDDLHRANLRRARDGAGRKASAEDVERRDPVPQLAPHLRDEMCDVREALGLEEALDPDAAGAADAGEVVAAEVDEHHVLGAILLGRKEPLGVTLARVGRSGDRVQAGATLLALDERLRGGADQREPVELEQEEIGRGVDAPQCSVELERRGPRRSLRALREHDLVRVPGPDVLLDPPHAGLILGPLRKATRAAGRRANFVLLKHKLLFEPLRDLVPVARQHGGRAAAVVEADERVRDDEAALRHVGAGRGQRHSRLELRDVVVGEIADDGLVERFRLLDGDDA